MVLQFHSIQSQVIVICRGQLFLCPCLCRSLSFGKKAYNSANNEYHTSEDSRIRCLTIVECILLNSSKIMTPLDISLAAQLHPEFGSHNLIDILHLHGFCINYDELRWFITGAAKTKVERLQGHVFIPNGIVPLRAGGNLIHKWDNIDINIETLHSMAREVF